MDVTMHNPVKATCKHNEPLAVGGDAYYTLTLRDENNNDVIVFMNNHSRVMLMHVLENVKTDGHITKGLVHTI